MKRFQMTFVLESLLCVFCAVGLLLVPQKLFAQRNAAEAAHFITAERVKPHIVKLSDDSLEGRGAGYKGEQKAAAYIAAEFKKIGLQPMGDASGTRRSYFQEFQFQPCHPARAWETLASRNVVGFLAGSDPTLKDEIIVIGAHYDGQGRTGQAWRWDCC